MRPWAKWLIRHKMRWTLYGILICAIIPALIFIAVSNIPKLSKEVADWVVSDWKSISKEQP